MCTVHGIRPGRSQQNAQFNWATLGSEESIAGRVASYDRASPSLSLSSYAAAETATLLLPRRLKSQASRATQRPGQGTRFICT
jgi:hypothetical protein